MNDQWTKTHCLDALHAGWSRWEALLAEVGAAWMLEPRLAGGWSIKDLIAHITWYEQQTVLLLQPHSGPGPRRDWLWACAAQKRNAILFTADRTRQLADVRAEAREAHAQLIAAVEALTAANIRAPQRFPGMPHAWQPWQFIARHSYEHYAEHIPEVRAWLDTRAALVDPPCPPTAALGNRPAARPRRPAPAPTRV
jgi:hypothetical protein